MRLKNRQNFNICFRNLDANKERWKANKHFERKVYSRILGPVYDNEKENWRILTSKEIYAVVKKSTITETIRLTRLCWFGHVQRIKENRIPRSVIYEFESNKAEM